MHVQKNQSCRSCQEVRDRLIIPLSCKTPLASGLCKPLNGIRTYLNKELLSIFSNYMKMHGEERPE